MPRVVQEEGIGWLVTDFSSNGVSRAIKACSSADIEHGRLSCSRARQKCCWDRQESTLLGIYQAECGGAQCVE